MSSVKKQSSPGGSRPPTEELPRDKYNSDLSNDGRLFTRLGFGFVMIEAALLVKDLLYGRVNSAPFGTADTDGEPEDGPEPQAKKLFAPGTIGSEADREFADGPRALGSSDPFVTERPELPTLARFSALHFDKPYAVFQSEDSFIHMKLGLAGPKLLPIPPAVNDNDEGGGRQFGVGQSGGTALALASSSGGGGSEPEQAAGTSPSDTQAPAEGNELQPGDGSPARRNQAPIASGEVFTLRSFVGQAVLIGIADLLRFVHDPDGDALSARNPSATSGRVEILSDGSMVFHPPQEMLGEVTITYTVSDGELEIEQTALIDIEQLPGDELIGTDADDSIIGTPGDDTIAAGGGADTVLGREGDDLIDAGDGDDRIVGGSGNDVILAGAGNDRIFGDAGDDTIYGGDGDDVIEGGDGNDLIFGEGGNDIVFAGTGNDTVFGGAGDDVLHGEAGDDLLDGGDGTDYLTGGAGHDILIGGLGRDRLEGGDGDDRFLEFDTASADHIDGGDGVDTLDVSGATEGAAIDLQTGTLTFTQGSEGGDGADEPIVDSLANIENVVGTRFADDISGDASDNRLDGGDGDDVLAGGMGSDDVAGGAGDDTIIALADGAADHYDGGEGRDTLDLSGNDTGVIVDLEKGEVTYTSPLTEVAGGTKPVPEVDTIARIEVVVLGVGRDMVVASSVQEDFWGGAGGDLFVFRDKSSSGSGSGSRDRIMDFEPGDKIELGGIMASFQPEITNAVEDEDIDRFVMIRDGDAFQRPGELRLRYESLDDGSKVAVLQGNVDHDADADFEIELRGFLQFSMDQIVY